MVSLDIVAVVPNNRLVKFRLCGIKKSLEAQTPRAAQTVYFGFGEAMMHNRKPNTNPTCNPIITSLPLRNFTMRLALGKLVCFFIVIFLCFENTNACDIPKIVNYFLNTINNQITT